MYCIHIDIKLQKVREWTNWFIMYFILFSQLINIFQHDILKKGSAPSYFVITVL